MRKRVKRIIGGILAAALMAGVFGGGRVWAAQAAYKDVAANAWYAEVVGKVSELGLMTGYGDGSKYFGPADMISRAQMAEILYRMAGKPETEYTGGQIFRDVKESDWYYKAAVWAKTSGVITGYENGKMGPGDPLTREQFAVMLKRFAEMSGTTLPGTNLTEDQMKKFADVSGISSFAKDGIRWAVKNEILTGSVSDIRTYLNPKKTATRAEAAAMIIRYLEADRHKSSENVNFGAFNMDMHAFEGKNVQDTARAFVKKAVEKNLDVIALEEFSNSWDSALTQAKAGSVYNFVRVTEGTSPNTHPGIMYNANKYELRDCKAYRLLGHDGRESYDGYGNKRFAISAEFMDHFGKRFVFIALHLEWADSAANAQQSRDIFDLAEQYRRQGVPVIVGGDFNNDGTFFESQTIFSQSGSFRETLTASPTYEVQTADGSDVIFEEVEDTWFGEGKAGEHEHMAEDVFAPFAAEGNLEFSPQEVFEVQVRSVYNMLSNGGYVYYSDFERDENGNPRAIRKNISFQSLGIPADINFLRASLDTGGALNTRSIDDIMVSLATGGYDQARIDHVSHKVEALYNSARQRVSDHGLVSGAYVLRYNAIKDPNLEGAGVVMPRRLAAVPYTHK